MLQYLKNNGFPVDLFFETNPYHREEDDYHGWLSKIFIDGFHYKNFIHTDYRDRVKWADGFFAAYEWEATGKYKWRGREESLLDEKGISNLSVGDWIVDKDGYVRTIPRDDDEALPFEAIKRFATEKEFENKEEINNILDELSDLKESNRSSWDTYGSELCAGDMIGQEKHLENKINELRNVSKTKV